MKLTSVFSTLALASLLFGSCSTSQLSSSGRSYEDDEVYYRRGEKFITDVIAENQREAEQAAAARSQQTQEDDYYDPNSSAEGDVLPSTGGAGRCASCVPTIMWNPAMGYYLGYAPDYGSFSYGLGWGAFGSPLGWYPNYYGYGMSPYFNSPYNNFGWYSPWIPNYGYFSYGAMPYIGFGTNPSVWVSGGYYNGLYYGGNNNHFYGDGVTGGGSGFTYGHINPVGTGSSYGSSYGNTSGNRPRIDKPLALFGTNGSVKPNTKPISVRPKGIQDGANTQPDRDADFYNGSSRPGSTSNAGQSSGSREVKGNNNSGANPSVSPGRQHGGNTGGRTSPSVSPSRNSNSNSSSPSRSSSPTRSGGGSSGGSGGGRKR